jgi:hypothetical protein
MRTRWGTLLASGLLLLNLACGDESTAPKTPVDPAGAMPDFSLPDVNPNSATHGNLVSPRQFLGSVSAYYFGSAT